MGSVVVAELVVEDGFVEVAGGFVRRVGYVGLVVTVNVGCVVVGCC